MTDNIRRTTDELRFQSEIPPYRNLYASDILVVNGQPEDLAWFKDLIEHPQPREGIKPNEWDKIRVPLRRNIRQQVKKCEYIPPRKFTLFGLQDGVEQIYNLPQSRSSGELPVPFLRFKVVKNQDARQVKVELEQQINRLRLKNGFAAFPVNITLDRVGGQLSRKGVGSPNHSAPQISGNGSFGIDYLSLIGWDKQILADGADGDGITVMILDTAPDNPTARQPFEYLLDLSEAIPFAGPDGNLAVDYPPNVKVAGVAARPPGVDNLNWQETVQYHGLLIAAVVKSIAPKANIFLVKVLNDDGENLESSLRYALSCIADCCTYKTRQHALIGKLFDPKKLVLNLSWGLFLSLYPELNYEYMLKTCQQLTELGVTIVAAAGNDTDATTIKGQRKRAYPAEPAAYGYDYQNLRDNFASLLAADPEFDDQNFPGFSEIGQVIPVAAIQAEKGTGYAAFSDFGSIGAPGEIISMEIEQGNGIPVILPTGNLDQVKTVVWSGSSFAAPQVAAAAALLLQAGVEPSKIKECLLSTADPRPDLKTYAPPTTELDIFQNHVPRLNIRKALESIGKTETTTG